MAGKKKKTVKSRIEIKEWHYLALFFVLVFVYFFFWGGYLLFFQEQQSLFVYTFSYLQDFLIRPGGLLDYIGRFLTQFYINRLSGSLILAAALTLPGILLHFINRRLLIDHMISGFLTLLPSCLLLIMQTHYYHLMMYNFGYLLVLGYFLLVVASERKLGRFLLLILFPLFFYLTGAFGVIFLCLFIFYSLSYIKGPQKYYLTIQLLLEASLSAVFFKNILLLQTWQQLVLFPFPFINDPVHKIMFYLLTGMILLYPLICGIAGLIKPAGKKPAIIGTMLPVALMIALVFILIRGFNSQTARVINMQKLIFEEKWDEAVSYQVKYPATNLIGEFFYNVALSQTDQLSDRLFYGRQDFGTGSLILEWNSEHINWGAYSFYAAGLINEAQRWAYEEMVVYGLRAQNLKLLTKTSLLTGNYRLAKKYTGILKNSLFYKNWAEIYEKLADDTSKIRSDRELGSILKILPENDFFIHLESPEANLPILVDENPKNHRAFEYMMAWLLLGKNVDILVNNVRLMKNMGYTRIPRHIEEAIMIYYNSQRVFPDMGGLTISNETLARFDKYFAAYIRARQNPATLRQTMEKQFSNTFWFYFHFR